jgi:hypothetical protein
VTRETGPPIGTATLALALLLSGCSTAPGEQPATSMSPTAPVSPSTPPTPTADPTEEPTVDTVTGTTIRFTAPDGTIDVTLDEDNPAVRDLLTMLPLTLDFEDFNGVEKIAYPPRDIQTAGSPPSSAGAGDLAIYVPWGDIAFFYAGERGAPSADIVHLGVFDATLDQLQALESGDVTVAVVD